MDVFPNKLRYSIQIDQLVRSSRRSIGLTITRDAQLIVRAPLRTPVHEIERLVAKKSIWINQKQELSRQRIAQLPPALSVDHKKLLQRQALDYISTRVAHFANQAGLSYKSVRINNAKTRWGSCSHNGRLNFTWRLIIAPVRVIDYVVVHELMHLKQLNHSPKFWREVRQMIPDYKADERWLKENSMRLAY